MFFKKWFSQKETTQWQKDNNFVYKDPNTNMKTNSNNINIGLAIQTSRYIILIIQFFSKLKDVIQKWYQIAIQPSPQSLRTECSATITNILKNWKHILLYWQ